MTNKIPSMKWYGPYLFLFFFLFFFFPFVQELTFESKAYKRKERSHRDLIKMEGMIIDYSY